MNTRIRRQTALLLAATLCLIGNAYAQDATLIATIEARHEYSGVKPFQIDLRLVNSEDSERIYLARMEGRTLLLWKGSGRPERVLLYAGISDPVVYGITQIGGKRLSGDDLYTASAGPDNTEVQFSTDQLELPTSALPRKGIEFGVLAINLSDSGPVNITMKLDSTRVYWRYIFLTNAIDPDTKLTVRDPHNEVSFILDPVTRTLDNKQVEVFISDRPLPFYRQGRVPPFELEVWNGDTARYIQLPSGMPGNSVIENDNNARADIYVYL